MKENKLNKLSGQIIADDLAYTLRELQQSLASPPSDDSPASSLERYYMFIGQDSFTVGAYLCHEGADVSEIRALFAQSGRAWLRETKLREPPVPTDARNPWDFLKVSSLVIAFCKPGTIREELCSVREPSFRNPPRPYHLHVSQLVGLIQEFIAYGEVNRSRANALAAACDTDTATQDAQAWVRPVTDAFIALTDRNPDAVRAAMATVLQSHQREATLGEYAKTPDGLLCVPGLMIAQLAAERDLPCDISSPYLPLHLL